MMMTKNWDAIVKALKPDATLPDKLNAEAAHAETGTTSISSIAAMLREAAAHIAALEAEVAALKNPPYRIVINKDDLGSQHDEQFYQGIVTRGGDEIMLFDWWDTEDAARAEAQQFIDKLPASFGAKDAQ